MAWLLFSNTGFVGADAFYHFRIASEIAAGNFIPNIDSLPLTLLGRLGVDHHWILHVVIAPVTLFSDNLLGLKLGQLMLFALVPFSVNLFLRSFHVPYAWAFTLFALVAAPEVAGRFSLMKAQSLAIPFLLAAFYFAHHRKTISLFFCCFLFMWTYHGAFMVLGVAGSVMTIQLLATRDLKQVHWALLIATISGLFSGLVFNPWYPGTIEYFLFHIHFTLSNPIQVEVGSEWSAYTWMWWKLLMPGFTALMPLMAAAAMRYRELRSETLAMLLLALIFTALLTFADRFVDYFGPTVIIASALVYRDMKPAMDRLCKQLPKGVLPTVLAAWLSIAATVNAAAYNGSVIPDIHIIGEGTRVLEKAKDGELVLNNYWHDYAFLVFHLPDLGYVSGLDPHYLLYENPDAYVDYMKVVHNQLPPQDDVAAFIRDKLGASWVFLSLRHPRDQELSVRLQEAGASLSYRSDFVEVYQLTVPRE